MRTGKLSIVGIAGLGVGLISLLIWISSVVASEDAKSEIREPESFIPSETIKPEQDVAFPIDI